MTAPGISAGMTENLPDAVGSHALVVEGLTKDFGGFTAVNSVDLRVRRETIHALIGPNGAGKTTCFNLITRFIRPTSGRIFYNGQDITSAAPEDVASRGLVR